MSVGAPSAQPIVRGSIPACAGYQDALLDFVDCGEAGPGVEAALEHLERCQACTRDLAATALVLTALRRMFDEARAAETPADAWPRLRARLATRQRRRWAPGTISGLVTGAALVTALLLPNASRLDARDYVADQGAGQLEALRMWAMPADGIHAAAVHVDRANAVGGGQESPASDAETSYPAPYPDNIRPALAVTASAKADDVTQRAVRPA